MTSRAYANADFSNTEMRDTILEYFVDKIYLYDDKLIVTTWYSEQKYEVGIEAIQEGMKEFEHSKISSANKLIAKNLLKVFSYFFMKSNLAITKQTQNEKRIYTF